MFRATRRSVSERARFSTRAKILLLLPICAFFVFGVRTVSLYTVQGGPAGPRYTSDGMVTIVIQNLDEPLSQWRVGDARTQATEQSGVAGFRYQTKSISSYEGLFGWRASMRHVHASTITAFHDLHYRTDKRLERALERESGNNWYSFQHPDFQNRVLPVIHSAVAEAVLSWADEEAIEPTAVAGSMTNGGALLVEVRTTANRWEVIPKLFVGTIPLWIFLSVCLIVVNFITRERKAQRWVTMKCPKCGYQRQTDREECPECGLKYERPSYVMWDPTEERASSGSFGGGT